MFPPELLKRLEEAFKVEGGGLFGLAGCPAMTYFAAHAPQKPEWFTPEIEDVSVKSVEYGLAAEALWRWAYARAMVKYKTYDGPKEKKG